MNLHESANSPEYRLFFFILPILKPIQLGIQAGHSAVNLMKKYCVKPLEGTTAVQREITETWAYRDETFILLDAKSFEGLHYVIDLLESPENHWPFAVFKEDMRTLAGLETAVCVVVPEELFRAKKEFPKIERAPYFYRYTYENGKTIDYPQGTFEARLIECLRYNAAT